MLHSKVAMFKAEQAARTMLTARIFSDVSITRMGVDELISTLRRSRESGTYAPGKANSEAITTKGTTLHEEIRFRFNLRETSCPSWLMLFRPTPNCLTS